MLNGQSADVNLHNADSTTGRKAAADAATIVLSNEDKAVVDNILARLDIPLSGLASALESVTINVGAKIGLVKSDGTTALDPATEQKQDAAITILGTINTALGTLNAKDFATQTTLSALNAKFSALGPQLKAASVSITIATDQGAIPVSGPLTDTQLRATPVPISGTVAVSGSVAVTGPLTDTQLRATAVPVSGPLTDTQLRASAVPVSGTVAISGTVPVSGPLTDTQLRATPVPVSGPLTDTQLRASAVPVSGPLTDVQLRASAVPISGTVTANIGTTNGLALDATVSAMSAKLPAALGQTTMAASISVTIASNQSAVSVTGPITDTQLRATPVPVSGTVTANIGTTNGLALDATVSTMSGKLPATLGQKAMAASLAIVIASDQTAVPVSGPLTDTQLRASAVPVSGPLTDTQLRATPVPISGTVTANLGTIAGVATEASLVKLTIAQGAALGANTGAMVMGSVTTAEPAYTTGQISPISLTVAGRIRVEDQGVDITGTGTIAANGASVSIIAKSLTSAILQVTGVWVGTLQVQGLQPDGTWTNLSVATGPAASALFTSAGITANGAYRVLSASGYTQLRVFSTAWTSGTATINIVGSDKVAAVQSVQLYAGNMQVEAHASDGFKASYSATITGLNAVNAATDIFTITGSATKTIRVVRITFTGTQTTGDTIDVLLVKRSAANTGGTSTTPTVVPNDSQDAAGTAVVRAYTANPTVGAAVGTAKSVKAYIPAAQPANSNSPFWNPDLYNGNTPAKAIVLRGIAEVLAVNLNGQTLTGESLDITIEWTEE